MPDYTKKAGRKIQHFAKGGKVEDYGSEDMTEKLTRAKDKLTSDLNLNERTDGALVRNYNRRTRDIADGVRKNSDLIDEEGNSPPGKYWRKIKPRGDD